MDEFHQGVIHAVAQIIALHDMPSVAADVLIQAGLEDVDCSTFDDYEKTYLQKLKDEPGINLKGL